MKKETPTFSQTQSHETRSWCLVDAKDKTVGRLASALAGILRGKDKPAFSPHIDNGDFVVVINARHIRFTGNKLEDKRYYRHTGYPGGIRSVSAGQMLEASPEDIIRKAVRGMLPKNAFGRQLIKKLKVYPDADHRHNAQSPVLHS